MADKWAQFVLPDKSAMPPPGADKWAQFAVSPNSGGQEQPGTLERTGKAFKEWTPPAPASDWPELGPKFRQQLVDLYHGIAGIVPQTNAALQKTGDAMLRGDALDTARQAPGIVPVVGPMTQQIGQDVTEGKYPEAVGHTLNLGGQVFGPSLIAGAPRAAEAVTSAVKTAAPVVAGAAKGAVKAIPKALETSALKYTGVPQIARGAINGAKAALAERVQAAAAKARAAETPPPPPAREPAGLLSAPPHTPPAPADTSFVRSVPGEYPAQQAPAVRGLLPAGPNVIPMEAGADGSFVRSVPGEYPPNLPPEVMGELTRSPEAPAPPAASPIAAETAPTETAPQSQNVIEFPSSWSPRAQELGRQLQGELNGSGTTSETSAAVEAPPARDYAGEARANRTADATKLSDALKGNLSFAEANEMDPSHWKMLADGIGVKVPNAKGIAETLARLKTLEEAEAPKLNPLQAAAAKEKTAAAARAKRLSAK